MKINTKYIYESRKNEIVLVDNKDETIEAAFEDSDDFYPLIKEIPDGRYLVNLLFFVYSDSYLPEYSRLNRTVYQIHNENGRSKLVRIYNPRKRSEIMKSIQERFSEDKSSLNASINLERVLSELSKDSER